MRLDRLLHWAVCLGILAGFILVDTLTSNLKVIWQFYISFGLAILIVALDLSLFVCAWQIWRSEKRINEELLQYPNIIDVLFSRFKIYRRITGGVWYHVWDLPHYQGGFMIWTRTLLPRPSMYKLLDTEDYRVNLSIL